MDTKGKLYVVATPIGNKADITLRALDILKNVDLIAAEDTRHTGKFLTHYNIHQKMISCHEYNERERALDLIEQMNQGVSIALVSDAGTPSVSDPGYYLIKEAIENNITVVPVPGVSAAISALSVSGLPTDAFIFIGFLPKKKGARIEELKKLSYEEKTLIFYESPKRIISFLEELMEIMGDRYAVLGREISKLHEEFLRDSLSQIIFELTARASIKGEITLLVKGYESKKPEFSIEALENEIEQEMNQSSEKLSELSKRIAKKYGISKKVVYEKALKMKL